MANARTAAHPRAADLDPVRWLWRGLTSVRFALGLIAFLALASLLGVLIPQVPSEMRGNPAAIAAWTEFQRGRFGFLTDPMYRAGLFDLFRSVWFGAGLALLVGSVCVCTANRLPPVWRNVTRPQTRVPDEYFEHGQSLTAVEASDAGALATALRRRRYKVSLNVEGDTTYLFADRFPWAQFATFISHLALILFLAGGLVTMITAREQELFIPEGDQGAPVFSPADPDHMQVYVQDAVGSFTATGFPRDFRTALSVNKGGREVARGVTTVNHPLKYGGYLFHQSAYFPDGAAIKVTDVDSGRVVYDEVFALTSTATTPRVVIRDAASNILLDDAIVPTDFVGDLAGTLVSVPGQDRSFWIGARPGSSDQGWQLIVFETASQAGARSVLGRGQQQDLGGLSLTFAGMTTIPSVVVNDLPGANADSIAELSDGPQGKLLTIGPVGGQALALSPGQPVVVNGLQYTFEGQREFAGITVRRDPGSTFIWLATGTFLLGLALTFYTPRRRLWGKIAAGQAAFRGLGGRNIAIEREIREAAARAAETASARGPNDGTA